MVEGVDQRWVWMVWLVNLEIRGRSGGRARVCWVS